MGYLTPNSDPGTRQCRVLFIPDDEDWLAVIAGTIQSLTEAENWVQWGTLTPQQTADVWLPLWDDFCFRRGACKLIGEIVQWAGTTNPYPGKWLDCDGSSLLRSAYPDLFSAIGTTYGAVDGTHFNLPDLRGRAVVDTGTGSGLTPRALGDVFGEETHTLTAAESASHSHTDSGHTHSEGTASPSAGAAVIGVPIPSAIPSVGVTGSGSAVLSTSGGDGAHNNIQPSLALTLYIVALN